MYLVGLSVTNQGSTVALLKDGTLVTAASEPPAEDDEGPIPDFPEKSLRYCLDQESIGLSDIDFYAFNEVDFFNWARLFETKVSSAKHFISTLRRVPKDLKEDYFWRVAVKRKFTEWLEDSYGEKVPLFHFCERDLAQASSTFYPSSYESAAVLCLDKFGRGITTSLWAGHGNELEAHWKLTHPHSFPVLLNSVAQYCGFDGPSGLKQLLSFATFGEPRLVDKIKEELIELHDDGSFTLNEERLDRSPEKVVEFLKDVFGGELRSSTSPVTVREIDLISSLIAVIDEWAQIFGRHVRSSMGVRNLCFSGESLMGSFLRERLHKSGGFEDIWFVESTSMATSFGAALSVWFKDLQQHRNIETPIWDVQKFGRALPRTLIS